jgi:vitamin K-dependent gamma-carboxylase
LDSTLDHSGDWQLARVPGRLLAPVDIASVIFFRIGLGAVMAWWAWDYLTTGRVRYYYVQPQFHFTYYSFEWVHPWPGAGMYLHFLALAILAVAIAAGFFYRAACILFAIGFTYVFLLDATNYQNHYYLIILLTGLLAIVPANRAVSVDAAFFPALRGDSIPAWCVWLIRFHIALPYFFGGIAKIDADWLSGIPLQQFLAPYSTWPLLGQHLAAHSTALAMAWAGMLFDLSIVPLLLWKPTRAAAYTLCVLFHLTNSVLFPIHIFPFFMILATTIFFSPDWPRRLLGGEPRSTRSTAPPEWWMLSPAAKVGFLLLAAYALFHLGWPLRHRLYDGDVKWTERGHYFSWRMMLRNKNGGVRYYVTDSEAGKTWNPNLRPILNDEQAGKFTKDPEMILQLAHFLADDYLQHTGRPVEVRALALMSLNGRKPQVFINPEIDLAKRPRQAHRQDLIKPLTEPLRTEPWSLPLSEWEKHVELPRMPEVTRPPGR